MPMSVCGAGAAVPPQAPRVTRKAATAARRAAFRPIEIPPELMDMYLNSLWVWRHLSSLPIGGTSEPAVQGGVAPVDEAAAAIGGEDHDQDPDHPIGDGPAGRFHRVGDQGPEPA